MFRILDIINFDNKNKKMWVKSAGNGSW